MAKVVSNYELVYIIDATKSEDEIKGLVEKFKSLIEANGTLSEVNEWGKRRLAYLINDMSDGYYVFMKFSSGPEFPAELKRILGITEGIMRYLVTVAAE